MSRKTLIIGPVFYIILCTIVAMSWMKWPAAEVFSGDASDYGRAAVHLAHQGFYSVDGIHPFVEREPGYSVFLAGIFLIFGDYNVFAVFGVQAFLFLLISYLFCRELGLFIDADVMFAEKERLPAGKSTTAANGQRIAGICFVLLLTCISVFHSIFSAYREGFALILLLAFALFILRTERKPGVGWAVLAGMFLGFSILTYLTFLLFPLFLLPFFWLRHWDWKRSLIVLVVPFIVVAPWFVRNTQLPAAQRTLSSQRMTYVWYVRGEQAERVQGIEPFMCLWAEYISRDWSHRSDACSFNGLKNAEWNSGKSPVDDAQVAALGQQKIRRHFLNYLWFSIFEVLELHLPFVGGGWSHVYNIAAALSSIILYIGCALGLRSFLRKDFLLFLLLPLYNTLMFILTDATPRYLIPVIFCYCILSAVGYDRLLQRFRT